MRLLAAPSDVGGEVLGCGHGSPVRLRGRLLGPREAQLEVAALVAELDPDLFGLGQRPGGGLGVLHGPLHLPPHLPDRFRRGRLSVLSAPRQLLAVLQHSALEAPLRFFALSLQLLKGLCGLRLLRGEALAKNCLRGAQLRLDLLGVEEALVHILCRLLRELRLIHVLFGSALRILCSLGSLQSLARQALLCGTHSPLADLDLLAQRGDDHVLQVATHDLQQLGVTHVDDLLVHLGVHLNLHRPRGELQCGEGLRGVLGGGAQADQQRCLAIAANGTIQDPGELALPEGHVRPLSGEGAHDIAEDEQALIDGKGLLQLSSFHAALLHPLGPGQVDDAEARASPLHLLRRVVTGVA
mmetsp:Transcript_84478/g.244210  ORF Transcript_84478/g.244210 Transcript_84478/m.244210 type:complete len:355 (-) Transcript_84478:716-1780(-)